MAYSRSPSSSSTEECAFSHHCAGIVHSMRELTSCAPLPWLLYPGYPLLTPGFPGEICVLLWVFSGSYPSKKIPDRLCAGMCGCRGSLYRGASGAVTRLSRLIWPITHGHVPSHESVRAHANRPEDRTLRYDPTRVTQASGEASCLQNIIHAGSPTTCGHFAHPCR